MAMNAATGCAGDRRPDGSRGASGGWTPCDCHAAASFWSIRRRKTVSRSSVSSALATRVRPASTAKRVIARWTAADAPGLVTTSKAISLPARDATVTEATPAIPARPVGGLARRAAEDDPKRVRGERAQQDVRRGGLDEPAVVEDRDVVADTLDVVEDVGRVEDRRLALQLAHQVEDVLPADGVERRDGLVEQDDRRPADERLGDAEALAHAARVGRRSGGRRRRRSRRARGGRRSGARDRRGGPGSSPRSGASRGRSSSRRSGGPGRDSRDGDDAPPLPTPGRRRRWRCRMSLGRAPRGP